ncbi:hypothetical protein OJ967_12425 [Peribacillus frigoritolerans]|uniref:hypothetical protein n=1 Tax=Peribacillus frigoritolerans TaxID=450367 RepID=UPI002227F769|nr:hypothetical protein [Peribacillus frigoritolerans]UYZ01229.1 hypothetical protein OJ967_12425 [Peribacillus frigoritolerans]
MKLYLVKRNQTDYVDFDEYDTFVIRAQNEIQVKNVLGKIKSSIPDGMERDYIDRMSISVLDEIGPVGIVCSSYNAG